ncbi:MAG: hypothetical protein QOE55_8568 [Acidobacteriaceae bacterium]|jgi:hypothetical protein|nr:hypothetical protein [Acidobacteriaceae bacterium]
MLTRRLAKAKHLLRTEGPWAVVRMNNANPVPRRLPLDTFSHATQGYSRGKRWRHHLNMEP